MQSPARFKEGDVGQCVSPGTEDRVLPPAHKGQMRCATASLSSSSGCRSPPRAPLPGTGSPARGTSTEVVSPAGSRKSRRPCRAAGPSARILCPSPHICTRRGRRKQYIYTCRTNRILRRIGFFPVPDFTHKSAGRNFRWRKRHFARSMKPLMPPISANSASVKLSILAARNCPPSFFTRSMSD